MTTDDLLARLDSIVHSDAPYGTTLRDTVRDAAAEVRALREQLTAANRANAPLASAVQSAIDWMDEPWAEPDSVSLAAWWRRLLATDAVRAATADPTPPPETDT